MSRRATFFHDYPPGDWTVDGAATALREADADPTAGGRRRRRGVLARARRADADDVREPVP